MTNPQDADIGFGIKKECDKQDLPIQEPANVKNKLAQRLLKITYDAQQGRLSLHSHEELTLFLKSKRTIQSQTVSDAFLNTDRGFYVNRQTNNKTNIDTQTLKASTYWDRPLGIGHGATISAPHMHAMALEYLKDHLLPGAHALDVGSGTGFLCSCMARMVGLEGRVVGIDHIPDLVSKSIENVKADDKKLLRVEDEDEKGPLTLVVGDGRLGYPDEAPYNAIHVGAASPHVPTALLEQLALGGRMIIPVGPEAATSLDSNQALFCIDKKINGEIIETKLMGVIYVPLTDIEHQLK